MNLTTIQLTDVDALAFIKFQKHYALIKALEDLKVFDLTNGSVEIHFDHKGQVRLIDIHNHFRPDPVEN